MFSLTWLDQILNLKSNNYSVITYTETAPYYKMPFQEYYIVQQKQTQTIFVHKFHPLQRDTT